MSTPGSCLIHYEVSMKSYEVTAIEASDLPVDKAFAEIGMKVAEIREFQAMSR